jgi:hypothetical protein
MLIFFAYSLAGLFQIPLPRVHAVAILPQSCTIRLWEIQPPGVFLLSFIVRCVPACTFYCLFNVFSTVAVRSHCKAVPLKSISFIHFYRTHSFFLVQRQCCHGIPTTIQLTHCSPLNPGSLVVLPQTTADDARRCGRHRPSTRTGLHALRYQESQLSGGGGEIECLFMYIKRVLFFYAVM